MKLFLVLLALIGSAVSLIPGNQYTYQYEGNLGIGIPEIRNRLSGTGLRATVDIQVVSPDQVIFKMKDIEVGQFLGDVACNTQMPIRYSAISGEGKLLEEAFAANFRKSQDGVLTVSKSDREWVTNLRKSVADMFLIEPVRANLGPIEDQNSIANAIRSRGGDIPGAFSVQEPSIFGYCTSDYTVVSGNINPLPSHQHQQSRAKDGQEPQQPYLLTRTINFNQCTEAVLLQQAGIGNASQIANNQFGDVVSRSSVMTAGLLREGDKYTIQSGNVQGSYSLNPLGIQQDKLRSITNQTINLESVQQIKSPFPLPSATKSVRSWNMEVASPYARDQSSPQWINFYNLKGAENMPMLVEAAATGIQINKEDIQKFTQTLDKLLDEAAAMMLTVGADPSPGKISVVATDEAKIVTHLESSFRLTRGIDQQNLQQLFDQYYSDKSNKGQMKLKLLIDACAAGGTGPSVSLLTSEMKKGRITPERIASIFFTFANNFIVPPSLSHVTEYVKSLDITKNPILASTVWINYASTLNRVCLNPEKSKYTNPYPVFGSEQCQPKQVIDSILPFFQSQFEKAERPFERIVTVHAMGNLATSEVVSTLANIVHGRDQSQVKAAAIYALTHTKVPSELRQQVFNILMPVVVNPTEQSYLRQAAVATLLTWRPAPSWWQQLAVSTWREPSNDMASFIYFLLAGQAQNTDPAFAREAKLSQFMLPLAKPYSPSARYSYALFWGRFSQNDFVSANVRLGTLKSEELAFPRNVFDMIASSLGGLRFSAIQAAYGYDFQPVTMSKIMNADQGLPQEWKPMIRSVMNRRTHEAFAELKDRMEPRITSSSVGKFSNIFVSMFDNLELLVPLSDGSAQTFIAEDIERWLRLLSEGKALHMTKFLNPAPIEVFIPTEIGLPFFAKVSVPSVNAGEGEGILRANGQKCTSISQLINAKTVSLNVTTNYKFATKTLSTLRAILPWSRKLVGAGVETMKSVTLPMTYKLEIERNHVNNVSLHVIPTHNEAYPLVHAHTVPFVVIKSMWPGQQPTEFEQFSIISVKDNQEPSFKRQITVDKTYTGLDAQLRYEGDIQFPFTSANIMGCYRHPERITELMTSPSIRMMSTTLAVNFGQSSTKEFHGSASYNTVVGCGPHPDTNENKPMFKPPQSQTSQECKQGLGSGYTLSANLLLNGTQQRYFEAMLMSDTTDKTKHVISAYIGRGPLPSENSPSVYCFDYSCTSPAIRSFQSLQKYLSSQVEIQGIGNIKGGENCNQKQYARIQIDMKVGDQRRKMLQKDLNNVCNYDPADPTVSFTTAPVYDEVNIQLDYQNSLPKPLLNASYHAYDIIRGWAFPHAYFNYIDVQNPSQKVQLTGNRYIGEGRWNMRAQLPSENINFDHFKIPSFIESIVPFGGLQDERFNTPKRVSESQFTPNQCYITKNKVRSFDGASISFTPENCPAYAVVNRDDANAPILLVGTEHQTKHFRGLVGSAGTGVTITFTTQEVFVDGKKMQLNRRATPINNSNGAHFADAWKIDNSVEINVPGNFSVQLSDNHVLVTPHSNMRSKFGGLCGSYSGSSEKEMVGPKNCIYNDSKLFAYAWTVYSGAGCEYRQYQKKHEEAKAYQQQCPKVQENNSTKMPAYEPIPHDCLEYVYQIRTRGGNICVSQRTIPMCYPMCKRTKDVKYQEVYDCWSEEYAPKELKRNLKRGYLKTKVHGVPTVTTSFHTDHAFICTRK